jgi:hypothetical protein
MRRMNLALHSSSRSVTNSALGRDKRQQDGREAGLGRAIQYCTVDTALHDIKV